MTPPPPRSLPRPPEASAVFARGRRPLQRFRRGQRGVAVIEGALSVSVLVLTFAGLTGIVFKAYDSDELGRAARAAARQVALLASAPASASALEAVACGAIRRELDLPASFDCGTTWTITIDAYEDPSSLLGDTPRTGNDAVVGGENGDMVRVRIAALREDPDDGEDAGGDGPDGGEVTQSEEGGADGDAEPLVVLAMGIARNERAE